MYDALAHAILQRLHMQCRDFARIGKKPFRVGINLMAGLDHLEVVVSTGETTVIRRVALNKLGKDTLALDDAAREIGYELREYYSPKPAEHPDVFVQVARCQSCGSTNTFQSPITDIAAQVWVCRECATETVLVRGQGDSWVPTTRRGEAR